MIFSSPFTTRPPRKSDWAGGVRGVVAVILAGVATATEVLALVLVPGGTWIAGALVALCVFGLVPGAAFACAFAGAWRGPGRVWGIIGGVLLLLPPLGYLIALIPFSIFYVMFVITAGFVGHVLGRKNEPERRFD